MNNGFEKILVLVDHSQASIYAAEEAAQLASKFKSHLFLLHIETPVSLVHSLLNNNKRHSTSKIELERIGITLKEKYGIELSEIEQKGELNQMLDDLVAKEKIDLVVVAGRKQSVIKEFVSRSAAENIAHTINCEVLCVYPGSTFSRIKQMVIPVGRIIPKRKIMIAYELAKKFASSIHLISLAKDATGLKKEEIKALMDTYNYLKEMTNIPVQCSSVIGSNIAEAAIQYAKKVKADLILVNSDTESKLKDSFISGGGRDIINHSPVSVLSVHSVMENVNKNS